MKRQDKSKSVKQLIEEAELNAIDGEWRPPRSLYRLLKEDYGFDMLWPFFWWFFYMIEDFRAIRRFFGHIWRLIRKALK
jgi:hypothetical protein